MHFQIYFGDIPFSHIPSLFILSIPLNKCWTNVWECNAFKCMITLLDSIVDSFWLITSPPNFHYIDGSKKLWFVQFFFTQHHMKRCKMNFYIPLSHIPNLCILSIFKNMCWINVWKWNASKYLFTWLYTWFNLKSSHRPPTTKSNIAQCLNVLWRHHTPLHS